MEELKTRRGFEERQIERLRRVKQARSAGEVERTLDDLRLAARSGENLMPALIDAVSTYATIGEISEALKGVWGEYQELDVTSSGLSTWELREITDGRHFSRPVRFLLAKGGLDGHTRGIWILADLLRSLGAEGSLCRAALLHEGGRQGHRRGGHGRHRAQLPHRLPDGSSTAG